MAGVELGVELTDEGGVHADEAAPRPELGFAELCLRFGWRAHVHSEQSLSLRRGGDDHLQLAAAARQLVAALDEHARVGPQVVHRPADGGPDPLLEVGAGAAARHDEDAQAAGLLPDLELAHAAVAADDGELRRQHGAPRRPRAPGATSTSSLRPSIAARADQWAPARAGLGVAASPTSETARRMSGRTRL